jgi:hypothetical protein
MMAVPLIYTVAEFTVSPISVIRPITVNAILLTIREYSKKMTHSVVIFAPAFTTSVMPQQIM